MAGITSEQVRQWMQEFAAYVEQECTTVAGELVLERDPSPDPAVVLAAFAPYRVEQVDKYLRGELWRILYPMTAGARRDWVRRVFTERIQHHVSAEWLRLRGP